MLLYHMIMNRGGKVFYLFRRSNFKAFGLENILILFEVVCC